MASIREEREASGSYFDNAPKSSIFIAHGIRVDGLIMAAWDLKIESLLKDVPGWAEGTRYDVSAKSDVATDEVLAKLNQDDFKAQKRHMLQLLLAERFSLRIHPEIKQSTIYELVATPRAAKLMTPVSGVVNRVSTCGFHLTPHQGLEIDSRGCPFYILLSHISQTLETDIVDHTGMTGSYAFHLMYRPSQMTPPSRR